MPKDLKKCPKCGRKLGKDDLLMTLSYGGRTTGEFCDKCLDDFKKQAGKITERRK